MLKKYRDMLVEIRRALKENDGVVSVVLEAKLDDLVLGGEFLDGE